MPRGLVGLQQNCNTWAHPAAEVPSPPVAALGSTYSWGEGQGEQIVQRPCYGEEQH